MEEGFYATPIPNLSPAMREFGAFTQVARGVLVLISPTCSDHARKVRFMVKRGGSEADGGVGVRALVSRPNKRIPRRG